MRAILLAVLLVPTAARAGMPRLRTGDVKKSTAAAAVPGTPLPSYAASTAPLTLEVIAARFGELDGKMNTLKADFNQFARMEGSDTVQQVEGDVLFKKPDLMRLTHRLPEKQTIVSDGTWLWVYRASTNQVIQQRLETWRKNEPLAKGLLDFGRSAELLKRYDAAISTVSAPGADGYRTFVVTLKPKAADKASSDADFTLTLKASTKDFFPYEASLNVGRASIRSTFSNVRLNPALPDDTFHFTPPAGADVFAAPTQP